MLGTCEQGLVGRYLGNKFSLQKPGWLACGSSPALGTYVGNFNRGGTSELWNKSQEVS